MAIFKNPPSDSRKRKKDFQIEHESLMDIDPNGHRSCVSILSEHRVFDRIGFN